MATYDPTSDQEITAIQSRVYSHFAAATQPTATTQPLNKQFYADVDANLHSLVLRTKSRGNDPSLANEVGTLQSLQEQLANAERFEGTGNHDPAAWQTIVDGVDVSFKGFLTQELARK